MKNDKTKPKKKEKNKDKLNKENEEKNGEILNSTIGTGGGIGETPNKKSKKRFGVIEDFDNTEVFEVRNNEKRVIYNGRFEIQLNKLIGKGSFGEIFLATDLTTNINYALKRVILNVIALP